MEAKQPMGLFATNDPDSGKPCFLSPQLQVSFGEQARDAWKPSRGPSRDALVRLVAAHVLQQDEEHSRNMHVYP